MGKREGRRWLLRARGAALVNGKAGGSQPRTIYSAFDALSPRVAFGGLKMVRQLTVKPKYFANIRTFSPPEDLLLCLGQMCGTYTTNVVYFPHKDPETGGELLRIYSF
jgi:hypothetical protein